jgi:uncharacterized protein (TIGR02677 family)
MTTFNRFGSLSIVNYVASSSERTDWYRSIMRTFFRSSHEYRYHLSAQEVMEEVQAETRQSYPLDTCKGDLQNLHNWGNLSILPDMSRVTTIADFKSPVLLYQATPEALEFEAFIEKHLYVGASEGGLHQGDLLHLLELIQHIHAWLEEKELLFTIERSQEVSETWKLAFATWERITNDAAQYLGNMNQIAQNTSDISTYIAYKQAVITYIQNFAGTLAQYSQRLRQLFLEWLANGKTALLQKVMATTAPLGPITADERAARDEDNQHQIKALMDWFILERNTELFSHAAHDAVDKVILHAAAFGSAMGPKTDYVSLLSNLATTLFHVDDLETARLLFTASFASTIPTHLSESVTGAPEAAVETERRLTWDSPPTVLRELRPIYKGNVERITEQPMRHNADAFLQLKQDHDTQLSLEQEQLDHLFQTPLLDLAHMPIITVDERLLLSNIIDSCLGSPVYEYTLSDGTQVTLLNPEEDNYVALNADDGSLFLPHYRLHYHSTSEKL